IRTTLPDGRIALNNIIDKYTGESIQLVKIDALPDGVSADGIIYFETSDTVWGTEYYRRAITTGQINVQWFGAKCDYKSSTNRSDSSLSIQNAIAFMKDIV